MSRPTFFSKAISSIIGPYDDIPYDSALTRELDWEAELTVSSAAGPKTLRADEALEFVFGYTALERYFRRDIQFEYGGQFF